MKKTAIRLFLGLPLVIAILSVGSSASAQTRNQGRWANAKDQRYFLSVAGGGQCGAGHGGCWFNNGQQIILWTGYSNDQLWWATQNGSGTIQSVGYLNPSQDQWECVGVTNGSQTPGANLIVWQCNGNSDQTWTAIPAGNAPYNLNAPGCFVFKTSDGQVMAVQNGTMASGSHVIQWTVDANHPATIDQAWCPQ